MINKHGLILDDPNHINMQPTQYFKEALLDLFWGKTNCSPLVTPSLQLAFYNLSTPIEPHHTYESHIKPNLAALQHACKIQLDADPENYKAGTTELRFHKVNIENKAFTYNTMCLQGENNKLLFYWNRSIYKVNASDGLTVRLTINF